MHTDTSVPVVWPNFPTQTEVALQHELSKRLDEAKARESELQVGTGAVVWCGVVWCGVVWCGVVWCGVVWCGVVWCGVV